MIGIDTRMGRRREHEASCETYVKRFALILNEYDFPILNLFRLAIKEGE